MSVTNKNFRLLVSPGTTGSYSLPSTSTTLSTNEHINANTPANAILQSL